MISTMDPQMAAASLVEVAVELARLEKAGEEHGVQANQVWFFLLRRNVSQLRKEQDDIALILETVGPHQAVRMTGRLAEHYADNADLSFFWRQAHERSLELLAAASAETA